MKTYDLVEREKILIQSGKVNWNSCLDLNIPGTYNMTINFDFSENINFIMEIPDKSLNKELIIVWEDTNVYELKSLFTSGLELLNKVLEFQRHTNKEKYELNKGE